MRTLIATCALSLLPFVGLQANDGISGTYSITGYDATLDMSYTGTVEIAQNEDTYSVWWTFNDGYTPGAASYSFGTALRTKDTLAINFQDFEPSNAIGVESLRIHNHGEKLTGPWVYFGDTRVGSETWIKVCE